jgi:hypothetical protein
MPAYAANKERIEQIVAARASGLTLQAIGQQFGLSAPRIRQILRNEEHKAACLERHAAVVALAAAGDHEGVLGSPSGTLFFRWLSRNTRIQKVLHNEGFDTIGRLAATTPAELLRCPNFGHRSLATLIAVLAEVGVTLQDRPGPGASRQESDQRYSGYDALDALPSDVFIAAQFSIAGGPDLKRQPPSCIPEEPEVPDVLELKPGVVVLRGPPATARASFFLQALLSAADKGLTTGYVSSAHPDFATRQLDAMLTYLGLTSRNFFLFADAPREAIEAERLEKLITECKLDILCIDDLPDHLAAKAEARAGTIAREAGCRVLIIVRPEQAEPPPVYQLPALTPPPAPLPSAKRRRCGKALKKPRGSRARSP